MASKLTGNGIFEGSRIILPEHREAFLQEMSCAGKTRKAGTGRTGDPAH